MNENIDEEILESDLEEEKWFSYLNLLNEEWDPPEFQYSSDHFFEEDPADDFFDNPIDLPSDGLNAEDYQENPYDYLEDDFSQFLEEKEEAEPVEENNENKEPFDFKSIKIEDIVGHISEKDKGE